MERRAGTDGYGTQCRVVGPSRVSAEHHGALRRAIPRGQRWTFASPRLNVT